MGFTVDYSTMNRRQADAKAIEDIQRYLGPDLFGDIVADALMGAPVKHINMCLGWSGVRGYPFHAFMRRYSPTMYRAWMESGDDAIKLDDENFPIE